MSVEQSHRLEGRGRIDRARPLRFTFDGRSLVGYPGDTLASALLANGVRVVGRSFKYHRRRGIFSAGTEEPNALVELRAGAAREPNTKATGIELYEGLHARSQNRWPSLAFDLQAVNGLFAPFLVAGFYYKTFMWPRRAWEKLYEPLIRRAAGLGRASGENDPDRYEKAHAFCDVLVVGSGPAGLMAARAAARSGARVILCEEDAAFGGRLLAERVRIDGVDAHLWADVTLAELRAVPGFRAMKRTTVFGAYDGGTYGALERVSDHQLVPDRSQPRQRLWHIYARQTVLATGAVERPIVFPGNDLPGVMLAGAVRTYLHRFGVKAGHRVAVFANNDDAWRTAADLVSAGVEVPVIVDCRSDVAPALRSTLGNTRVVLGGVVAKARGRGSLQSIDVESQHGRARIEVDVLAVSGGWTPLIGLATHLGAKARWDDVSNSFLPEVTGPAHVAGSARAVWTLRACLADGARAGADAAQACGRHAQPIEIPNAPDELCGFRPLWRVASRGKAFVDLQHDVTVQDIEIAQREGFHAPEHLKRYTTLGMATDQGRTSGVNALGILAEIGGRTIAELGANSFRPPGTPVAVGAFAGAHRGREVKPTRLTPSHDWARERGAVFTEAGLWLRAQAFPTPEEHTLLQTITREVTAVRSRVGFCDVSTLGKIDVFGTDAAAFLDRIYINMLSTLPVGKARYGVMLREDGFVLDDGTTSRLTDDHYYMTTTTANAARIMQHLEFCRQVLWPDLDVQIVSATDQWAQFAVAGPRSRELLSRLVDAPELVSNDALPFMGVRCTTVCGGIGARLFRVSFSGELAYELAVPASYGAALARELMRAGATLGVSPYGTEALGVMRIEKGHVSTSEMNGQTTAADLGMARMMSAKKDYIGRVMATRPALLDPERPTLAGFRPVDSSARLHAGAHFLALDAKATADCDEGHMTAVAFSPTAASWIGLGLIRRGAHRVGQRVRAYDPLRGADTEVEICPPTFVDPLGERLRA